MTKEKSKSKHHLGDFFSRRSESGRSGLPILSVTIRDGMVERTELERKMETNLTPEDHLLVKPGDIAYNMMRMWQGASGLVRQNGLVSPAYIVLKPKANVCSEYAAHLFKHPHMLYLFTAYSYGVTDDRLRLYFKDFTRIPFNFPSLQYQREASEILTIWDDAIHKTDSLITAKERRKKALMQQLLTGKRRSCIRKKLKWRKYCLEDFLIPKLRPVPRPDDSYTALGIRSHGKGTFLRGVEKPEDVMMDTLYEVKKDDLIVNITFAWEGAIALVPKKHEGALVSHRFPTYTFRHDVVIPDYFRYVILSKRFVFDLGIASPGGAGRNRVLDKEEFLKIQVSLPGVDEQSMIASILDACDEELRLLRDQLAAFRRQKQGLMQQLLTGKVLAG